MAPIAPAAADVAFPREGDTIRGYAAWPPAPAASPGLVLVPDVRGLSEHYRDVARRFAAEGFFTLALDLYSREGPPVLPDMTPSSAGWRRCPTPASSATWRARWRTSRPAPKPPAAASASPASVSGGSTRSWPRARSRASPPASRGTA